MNKNSMLRQAGGLFSAHIGGVIITLMFCLGLAGIMSNTWGQIAAQLIILLVYSFPVYSTMWSYGHSDSNRANYGHMKRDEFRGFKIALIANIPFFILAFLFALSKFGWFYNFIIPYRIINAEIWPLLNLIQISRFLPDYSWWQTLLFVLLPLLPVPIAGVSYIMGNRDFAPMQTLVYKNKKKKAQQAQVQTKTQKRKF